MIPTFCLTPMPTIGAARPKPVNTKLYVNFYVTKKSDAKLNITMQQDKGYRLIDDEWNGYNTMQVSGNRGFIEWRVGFLIEKKTEARMIV
jgi:hypothetical protein